jgi:hypothetical protein
VNFKQDKLFLKTAKSHTTHTPPHPHSPTHMIVKLLKTKDKEKIMTFARKGHTEQWEVIM